MENNVCDIETLCFQVCALSIMTVYCAYQNEFLLYEREHYKLPECKHLKRRLLKHFGTSQNCAKLSSRTFFFFLLIVSMGLKMHLQVHHFVDVWDVMKRKPVGICFLVTLIFSVFICFLLIGKATFSCMKNKKKVLLKSYLLSQI